MHTLSFKPVSFLSNYIERFYFFERINNVPFQLPTILPNTGLDLLFHIEEPLYYNKKRLSKIHTVCPRKIFDFDSTQKASFISVRFKSGRFRHFTNIPFTELNDAFISSNKLWPNEKNISIQHINNIKDKIIEIEYFLISMLQQYRKTDTDIWDTIIDQLYYNFNTTTIESISKENEFSIRNFQKNFKNQFGITAKQFQLLARFQHSIKKALLTKNVNYLDIALDNGYYDQSHFIKEFKTMTGESPLNYLTKENFENHFYHASLKNNNYN